MRNTLICPEPSIAVNLTLFKLALSTVISAQIYKQSICNQFTYIYDFVHYVYKKCTFVLSTTRKLPAVRITSRLCVYVAALSLVVTSLSFNRNVPRPLSCQLPVALSNANSLQLICITFFSSSSPVTIATSSYFRLFARLSSYSRADSVRLFTSLVESAATVFLAALLNNNSDVPFALVQLVEATGSDEFPRERFQCLS